jgi:hypothetical protein
MALKFAVNNSLSAITTLPSSISGGALNLISTQTASASASLEFSIDGTYDSYVFKFIDIHPATNNVGFSVNFRDGGSSYDATKTTTAFRSYNAENDEGAALEYETGRDLAQSTSAQKLTTSTGNDNDKSVSGYLYLFNPSSTTFVKHFIGQVSTLSSDNYNYNNFTAGYCNVTATIDGVQFTMSSGNIDDGIIKMYGVS